MNYSKEVVEVVSPTSVIFSIVNGDINIDGYALDANIGEIRQTYFFVGITSPTVMQDVLYVNATSRARGTIQAIRVSNVMLVQ